MEPKRALASPNPGFGLGLRTAHYADFLATPQPLDWLEIITDNYLVEGGKPLVMLDALRQNYPMVMHGVAMSLGAAGGVDALYLKQVKALADRIEPLWVSDHLCWSGPGPEQLHDLYPLPYTDEAARHVITQIKKAQDFLQRRLVIENVSSYIDFKISAASEWQFLAHIAQQADCLLLVDVNNIHVSSVNQGFNPLDYLQALPAERVQQIHLAGHCDKGDHIIDTHDQPVAPAVWALYAQACRLWGPVAAMIERDANLPDLPTLLAEVNLARSVAAQAATEPSVAVSTAAPCWVLDDRMSRPQLGSIQQTLSQYVLDRDMPASAAAAAALVCKTPTADPTQRLGIYHHAYRARLVEVLADTFAKTYLFMGSDTFDTDATRFVVAQPPLQRSLNRYGLEFCNFLRQRYPANPELHELAQLDWDLRQCFDGPDVKALDVQQAQADTQAHWLGRARPLHPSVRLRQVQTNVVQLWNAIHADVEVPPAERWPKPLHLIVWRQGLQPHFQILDDMQAGFMTRLNVDSSIESVCAEPANTEALVDPMRLSQWLQQWLAQGLLRAD
jgi:uncharacterized protein (UPF0276 family)